MKYFLLVVLALPVLAQSQKKLSLNIYLPPTIQKEKLHISYYTGKENKQVKIDNHSDTIEIRDTYYSEHVILGMQYVITTPENPCGALFYVDDQAAEIRILENDPSKNIFDRLTLKNVVNAAPLGYDQLNAYAGKEHAAFLAEFKQFQGANRNDSLFKVIQQKADKESAKRLEYILQHGNQYYAFYVFGYGYLNSTLVSVDSLIYLFNHVFPAKFRNNYEGKKMLSLLNIRKLREQQREAPDFTVTDINNQPVSLRAYRNKFVLINFWASWCVPCIQEFPALNTITGSIPEDKLVRIFITKDSDTAAFEHARKKYNVQGMHVFCNEELSKNYKAAAIPQVYLIDKNGKIIYDREELRDTKLEQLADIIKNTPELKAR